MYRQVAVGLPSLKCSAGRGGASSGTGNTGRHSDLLAPLAAVDGLLARPIGENGSPVIRIDPHHFGNAHRRFALTDLKKQRSERDQIATAMVCCEVRPGAGAQIHFE